MSKKYKFGVRDCSCREESVVQISVCNKLGKYLKIGAGVFINIKHVAGMRVT